MVNPHVAFTYQYVKMTYYRIMCSRMAPGSESFARACYLQDKMPHSQRHYRDLMLQGWVLGPPHLEPGARPLSQVLASLSHVLASPSHVPAPAWVVCSPP